MAERSNEELFSLSVSPRLHWAPLGLGFYAQQAVFQVFPWRSLALTFALMVLLLGPGLERIPAPVTVVVLLIVGVVGSGLELRRRRVFVTSTCIVRQAGLFRSRQRRLPLRKIHDIQVTYPSLGRTFDVGTVFFEAGPDSFTFVGLAHPEAVVARINALRRQAVADERAQARSSSV
jgi:uncharacterized membrane protein YdbT with pleckstrin-like domain